MSFPKIPTLKMDQWSPAKWYVLLVLVTLASMLPGFFSIPPVDRDETRFAQATRQMVASGDYIDIQFQDGKRYKKPIGIYWLQSFSVNAFNTLTGNSISENRQVPIWVYRIPSIAGVLGAVLATFLIARLFMTSFGAGLAGLFMALAILPGFEARIAKTDAFLLFLILLAQGILARAWLERKLPLGLLGHTLFWVSIGLGILVKGPIILLVTGFTLASLLLADWSIDLLKRLRPLSGVVIMLVMTVPWFVAIGIKSQGAFFWEAGFVDFLGKVASVKESHGGPPGIYTAIMPATFWPTSLFFLIALPAIIAHWRKPVVTFALAWVVPSWLVFELTPTKLPHYVLPLYPALALVTAHIFEAGFKVDALWQKIVSALIFVVPALLGIIVLGGLLYFEGIFSLSVMILALVAVAAGFYAWRSLITVNAINHTMTLLVICVVSTYLAVYQFGFPKLQTIWISNRMVTALDEMAPHQECPKPSIISVGYHEPSLAFLGPLDLRFEKPVDAVNKLEEAPCRLIFLTERREKPFLSLLAERGIALSAMKTIEGLALNGGDRVAVTLYRVSKPAVTGTDEVSKDE